MEQEEKNKILVVDDEPAQRMLLRINLEKAGYEVIEAEDGKEALSLCKADRNIRLMVTDLIMPDMDGYELIQQIRGNEINYTYILVLSSLDEKESVFRALSLGADEYISKPVWQDELNLRLQGGKRLLQLESKDELIFSMAKLSEYRCEETGYHLDRVKLYTRELARYLNEHHPELKIFSRDVEDISNVSTLHDIGKVAIPDQILHKPSKLTEEEFEHMKKHAEIGGNLLKDIYDKSKSNYLKLAYEIAMFHHEKWNGTGYPKGLSGNNIPVAARIMALADVYDALTSERSYKKAFGHEEARTIILEQKEKQFDPLVVEAFIKLEGVFLTIKQKYKN